MEGNEYSSKVLGWTRFKGAQDWLDRADPKSATSDEFKQFIAQSGFGGRNNLSEDELAKLFKGYTEWVRTQR